MQLRVIKADGSLEPYFHTKVLGTFYNALALIDDHDIFKAEQYANALTCYLRKHYKHSAVTSSQIHTMIIAMLSDTANHQAAEALSNYRHQRSILRCRIEVMDDLYSEISDSSPQSWQKSKIAKKLIAAGFNPPLARTIASSVEQKILNLQMTRITKSLISQLVELETSAMLRAEAQLQLAPA